jgi:hypothetical protein
MGSSHQRLLEVAAWEQRDALVKHVPEVVHPTRSDLGQRGRALGIVDQGESPVLVSDADVHSEDHGSRKLGNNVSPPSTKIV